MNSQANFSVGVDEMPTGFSCRLIRPDGAIFMERVFPSRHEAEDHRDRLIEAWNRGNGELKVIPTRVLKLVGEGPLVIKPYVNKDMTQVDPRVWEGCLYSEAMNTLDPKAPYGHCTGCTDPRAEGTHQEGTIEHPMMAREKIGPSGLTSKQIGELIRETGLKDEPLFSHREMVRRVIEDLITKGVLRVAKKATYGDAPGLAANCSECPHLSTLGESKYFKFCPGCGSAIQKP